MASSAITMVFDPGSVHSAQHLEMIPSPCQHRKPGILNSVVDEGRDQRWTLLMMRMT